MREVRGNEIAMIFQDPMTSLNPVYTVGWQIDEQISAHRRLRQGAARGARSSCCEHVGIPEPPSRGRRLPAPVLGRHAPARDDRDGAVVQPRAADRRRADDRAGRDDPGADPGADQAAAASEFGLGHHPDHARPGRGRGHRRPRRRDVRRADRRAGRPSDELFANPQHPYTGGCSSSIPRLDRPKSRRLSTIPGQPPSMLALPAGCRVPSALRRTRSTAAPPRTRCSSRESARTTWTPAA